MARRRRGGLAAAFGLLALAILVTASLPVVSDALVALARARVPAGRSGRRSHGRGHRRPGREPRAGGPSEARPRARRRFRPDPPRRAPLPRREGAARRPERRETAVVRRGAERGGRDRGPPRRVGRPACGHRRGREGPDDLRERRRAGEAPPGPRRPAGPPRHLVAPHAAGPRLVPGRGARGDSVALRRPRREPEAEGSPRLGPASRCARADARRPLGGSSASRTTGSPGGRKGRIHSICSWSERPILII